jgi:hypothetical protein
MLECGWGKGNRVRSIDSYVPLIGEGPFSPISAVIRTRLSIAGRS